MRFVKAFRATNHEELERIINDWLRQNGASAVSISIDRGSALHFHAFIVYERATTQ